MRLINIYNLLYLLLCIVSKYLLNVNSMINLFSCMIAYVEVVLSPCMVTC